MEKMNEYQKLLKYGTYKQRKEYFNKCLLRAQATIIQHGHDYCKTEAEMSERQRKFMDNLPNNIDGVTMHAWIADANGAYMYGVNIENNDLILFQP